MYLFYFDESGDSGFERTPTGWFVIAALAIKDEHWLKFLDEFHSYRRFLRKNFGLSLNEELKASDIVNGRGPWKELGFGFNARLRIYSHALSLIENIATNHTLDVKCFAICIDKKRVRDTSVDLQQRTWIWTFQRVERFLENKSALGMVFPDSGYEYQLQLLLRKMRRFSYVPSAYETSALRRDLWRVIEDPNIKDSKKSYFVQIADLIAYAAFRHVCPSPKIPTDLWNNLGSCRLREVNRVSGGPVGIVLWPKK